MTIQEAAKTSIVVQDACNLSGVVHAFSEAISAVRDEAYKIGEGTDWINSHPICILFSDKISSLTKNHFGNNFFTAYNEVEKINKGETK